MPTLLLLTLYDMVPFHSALIVKYYCGVRLQLLQTTRTDMTAARPSRLTTTCTSVLCGSTSTSLASCSYNARITSRGSCDVITINYYTASTCTIDNIRSVYMYARDKKTTIRLYLGSPPVREG